MKQKEVSYRTMELMNETVLPTTAVCDEEKSTAQHRGITFGTVQIFEFLPQLGDNPAVSSGCPIALGWQIQGRMTYDVESYEKEHPSNSRKSSRQLRIPTEERTRILLDVGHTRSEIVGTARDAYMIRNSRRRSTRQKQMDIYYGALLSARVRIASRTSVESIYSCNI